MVDVNNAEEVQRFIAGVRKRIADLENAIVGHKQEERSLRKEDAELKQKIAIVPGIVTKANAKTGYFIQCNPALTSILGFSSEEFTTRPFIEFIHPDDRQSSIDEVRRQLKGHPIAKLENRYICKDGSYKWLEWMATAADANGIVYAAATDITKRKQAERDREQAEKQLLQAQKLESIGRLAGGVAHDFNNMLSVILGHTESAMQQVAPGHPLHADLTEIHAAAKRSMDLTRQLLTFARKQTITPMVLDLNGTVAGILKMLRRLIGEDIDLDWLSGVDVWPVKMDPSQIDQILTNLCVNARDAIAGVGKVVIKTRNTTFDEAHCVRHPGFFPGEYVMLGVRDNGCGMDKATLDKVYEPFFTTKQIGKGTGLGLATVYGIVKQNDGFINVYSDPGQGTNFKIFLPRHMGKVTELRKEDPAEPVKKGHETILLVEDEPVILKMMIKLLKRHGYTVLAANTSAEAIRLARESTGRIHLLMTDVVMPEINGGSLAKKLLSDYPHLKCLFMSGYTADIIADRGALDEGVHFIQKPFASRDIAAKVRAVLDSE